jgi:hypothetical protein
MTPSELEAIRARDCDYDDVFEAQANMSKDIAHRLAAWPVADRRALLAYVDALRAAAGKVQCFHCGNLISEAWTRLGPCPSCADLRKLLGEKP